MRWTFLAPSTRMYGQLRIITIFNHVTLAMHRRPKQPIMGFFVYLTAFLASVAGADITTSVWLPGAANANQTFLGSVVDQNGDFTVLSLAYVSTPTSADSYTSAPATVTIGGTTSVAYKVSASDTGATTPGPMVTVSLDCNRLSGGISAVPTCTVSTMGANQALSALCSGLTVSSLPDYCTNSDAQTFEQTLTFSGESQYYLNNYQLIITAGSEKLAAVGPGTKGAPDTSATGPQDGPANVAAVSATGPAATTAT